MTAVPSVLLVVPDSNTTMMQEVPQYSPALAGLRRVGVPRPPRPMVAADLPQYRQDTMAAVRAAGGPVDLVLYGCTFAGFMAGPEGDAEVVAELEALTGAPVVSTSAAMVQALRHSGIGRVDVVTPYLPAVNAALRRYLEASGVEVTALSSFELQTVAEYAAVSAGELLDRAGTTATPAAGGMFLACTQLRTREALPPIRAALGRPVWSAIQATVWQGLLRLGLPAERLAA